MAFRSRQHLHLSKLEDFAAWLEKQGWRRVPAKGHYEVLRMVKPNEAPLIVHARDSAKEHATTWGTSGDWFKKWRWAIRCDRVSFVNPRFRCDRPATETGRCTTHNLPAHANAPHWDHPGKTNSKRDKT